MLTGIRFEDVQFTLLDQFHNYSARNATAGILMVKVNSKTVVRINKGSSLKDVRTRGEGLSKAYGGRRLKPNADVRKI